MPDAGVVAPDEHKRKRDATEPPGEEGGAPPAAGSALEEELAAALKTKVSSLSLWYRFGTGL